MFGICCNRERCCPHDYQALYALQHRGQESCGIAVNNDGVIKHYSVWVWCPMCLMPGVLGELGTGDMAVGHTRSAVKGELSRLGFSAPLSSPCKGPMALCHNGSIVNARRCGKPWSSKARSFTPVPTARLSPMPSPMLGCALHRGGGCGGHGPIRAPTHGDCVPAS